MFRLGQQDTALVIACIVVFLFASPSSQQTNCEPVNVGLIAAIPWDISNTLRAPIGGPVSLALSAVMALILLFGFLLAPVNYILGYPARIYHPARRPGVIQEFIYNMPPKNPLEELAPVIASISNRNRTAEELYRDGIEEEDNEEFRKISSQSARQLTLHNEGTETSSFPDFLSSAFFLIPEEDTGCRKLILCHAHGFLTIFPTRITRIVRFFR